MAAVGFGRQSFWEPRKVLVTGAGPIGLLAALKGFSADLKSTFLIGSRRDRNRSLCALSARPTTPARVANIGLAPDIIIECTGVGQGYLRFDPRYRRGGVVCLTGIGKGGAQGTTADVAAAAVLKNVVIVGSVNANKRHWYKAGEALARADRTWLAA